MAVSVILEEYFGLLQTPTDSESDNTTSRLENLEAKCDLLTETVAELQTALATLQASSSQSVGYKDSLHEQPQALPLQGKGAAESINSPLIEQAESLELAAVNGLLGNQSEPQQLPTLEALGDGRKANRRKASPICNTTSHNQLNILKPQNWQT